MAHSSLLSKQRSTSPVIRLLRRPVNLQVGSDLGGTVSEHEEDSDACQHSHGALSEEQDLPAPQAEDAVER